METMRPKVSLVNITPKPLETLYWCRRAQKEVVPDTLDELTSNMRPELEKGFRTIVKDGLSPFFEYISMVWKIENVSRALQQQLTRHRVGFAYSIQSLRVVDMGKFADEGRYHCPATVKDKEYFHDCMVSAQRQYNSMIADGESIQDARGILPLNIHSTITMTCHFKAFIGMINKRLCKKTQGEFQNVAMLMIEEVRKVDPILVEAFGEPCRFGPCILIPENEEQIAKGKLEGKVNTDKVCPLYLELGLDKVNKEN